MLGHCGAYILVDWKQRLTSSPIHLAYELTTECVDDTRDGRSFAFADEVEVQHALDGSWLEAVDEASGLLME